MVRRILSAGFIAVFLTSVLAGAAWAQTGKISGQVTEAESGEPLPGVNVVVTGTQIGATTNADGNYTILNVPPGTYSVQASFVGYANETVEGVEVNIDLTTQLDFALEEQTQELQEVTVQAQERVVKADVSSSRIDISPEDVENMPLNDVENVVGLQAGIRPNLQIRGSGRDEVSFNVDGLSMSSSRTNSPYTNISYTSVQQVQVQTGGFNAEYGNVRAGMINVVTREGPRDRYTVDLLGRYAPPQKKHFGPGFKDQESYFMRPYKDPEVKMGGTSQWDSWTQRQYPDFVGYEELSNRWNADEDNPNLSPEQIEQLFDWRHRRDVSIDAPDYEIDGSLGGPVPVIGEALGDLRFFASYRQEQSEYIHPLSRDGYEAYNGRVKLTTNPTSSIKLNLTYMQGEETGANCTRVGATAPCRFGDRELTRRYDLLSPPYRNAQAFLFVDGWMSRSHIQRNMASLSWTHTLGSSTFYEAKLQRLQTEYDAHPLPRAESEIQTTIGPLEVDQAPFGWWFEGRFSEVSGINIGGHSAEFRDTSQVSDWTGSFDLTSQIDQYNQVKAGVQFRSSLNDINYGHIDFLVNPNDVRNRYEETMITGSVYAQDKIEYLGMIANVGVRLDYQDPNTRWWAYDDPFTEAFMGKNADQLAQMLERAPVDPKWKVSPRLGVSFPITDVSKLYFNWGQFAQYLEPEQLYTFERQQSTNALWRISNPGVPQPQTTQFELGYEQSLFDKYLIRIAGYYKDVKNETEWIQFNSRSGLVDYQANFANQYRDIRGAEFSLYKNVGTWFRGFVNYTYQVEVTGQFGLPQYFESPVQQANFEEEHGANFPFNPVPQPYGRINLDFMTPPDFGPAWGSFHPVGDWRLNILGRWRAGDWFTYTGNVAAPNVVNNMQWQDYRMVDLRLLKNLNLGPADASVYLDVSNVLNLKNFNPGAFIGAQDFQNYMNSLRLKEKFVEDIPGWDHETGSDKPGELDEDKIFDPDTGEGYIDPPNNRSVRSLWPRRFQIGARFTF